MTFCQNSKFSEIYLAWEKTIKTGEVNRQIVRDEICESWMRCYQANVNPERGDSNLLLSLAEQSNLLRENEELLIVARPIISKLYAIVAGSGFIVLLSNKDGYVMESIGDDETMTIANNVNLAPGAGWVEEEVGTNGIGTALVLKKPVQVSGPEHYCRRLHFFTCSAAPIFNDSHEIIGALQLSGPSELAYAHTLGMVVTTVQAIEDQLTLKVKNKALTILNQHINCILETMSDGVLTVDSNGKILQMNPEARRILNQFTPKIEGLLIDELLDINPHTKEMLKTGQSYDDVEVIAGNDTSSFHCLASGRPIKDNEGKIVGQVIFIAPIKDIKKLVNRFSGAHATFHFSDIIGTNKDLLEAIHVATLAAGNESNVLICGESGTGKELFAQAIHNHSSRSHEPFVAVNCGAIPRELIGSELMGYVEGAFTGAARKGRPGKFELASGGTLFLDEIGDMPMEQQVSLLRVLQERKIIRIGGNKVIPVDVRIICATNKNLLREVHRANFRQDLYYRLNVISITLPPLRNRPEDIPLYFNHFLNNICQQRGLAIKTIDPAMLQYLQEYNWPGNVRELQNVIEKLINLTIGERIEVSQLPDEIISPATMPYDVTMALPCISVDTVNNVRKKRKDLLAYKERDEIMKSLSRCGGNISDVAKSMNVCRNTVYRKIKQYNITLD